MNSIEVREQTEYVAALHLLRIATIEHLKQLRAEAPTKAPYSLHNAIIEQLNHTIEVESSVLLRYKLI